jgi:hypothetical protein
MQEKSKEFSDPSSKVYLSMSRPFPDSLNVTVNTEVILVTIDVFRKQDVNP